MGYRSEVTQQSHNKSNADVIEGIQADFGLALDPRQEPADFYFVRKTSSGDTRLGSDEVVEVDTDSTSASCTILNETADSNRIRLVLSFAGRMVVTITPTRDGTSESHWLFATSTDGGENWSSAVQFGQNASGQTLNVDLSVPPRPVVGTVSAITITNSDKTNASQRMFKLLKRGLQAGKMMEVGVNVSEADHDDGSNATLDIRLSARDNPINLWSDPIFRIKSKPPTFHSG